MFKKLVGIFLIVVLASFVGAASADVAFVNSVLDAGTDFTYSDDMIKATVCDLDGQEMTGEQARAKEGDYFVFFRGYDTVYVTYDDGHANQFVLFSTRDPRIALEGVKIGDPISKVLSPGVINGDYVTGEKNGVRMHNWTDADDFVSIADIGGKISEIARYSTYSVPEGAKINWELADYLERDFEEKPREDRAKAAPEPQDSADRANTSTDSAVIASYPLSQKEKNTLSIQQRGAYNLYAKKKYKDAYAAFAKLADEYGCNYLSAYWAGVAAQKLRKNDEARDWFERVLEINPDYKPASDALAKIRNKR
jgi:tetratricopeptide (TPR) repeat protein